MTFCGDFKVTNLWKRIICLRKLISIDLVKLVFDAFTFYGGPNHKGPIHSGLSERGGLSLRSPTYLLEAHVLLSEAQAIYERPMSFFRKLRSLSERPRPFSKRALSLVKKGFFG